MGVGETHRAAPARGDRPAWRSRRAPADGSCSGDPPAPWSAWLCASWPRNSPQVLDTLGPDPETRSRPVACRRAVARAPPGVGLLRLRHGGQRDRDCGGGRLAGDQEAESGGRVRRAGHGWDLPGDQPAQAVRRPGEASGGPPDPPSTHRARCRAATRRTSQRPSRGVRPVGPVPPATSARRLVLVVGVLVALVVGLDRLMLGVHTLTEVVAGYALGVGVGLLAAYVVNPVARVSAQRVTESRLQGSP